MEKQTTFQVNLSQRRRRLANVRITVSAARTVVDGVAWGNDSAPPLALGLLIYAALAFAPDGNIKTALQLAMSEYDPESEIGGGPTETVEYRQPPLDVDDIPF